MLGGLGLATLCATLWLRQRQAQPTPSSPSIAATHRPNEEHTAIAALARSQSKRSVNEAPLLIETRSGDGATRRYRLHPTRLADFSRGDSFEVVLGPEGPRTLVRCVAWQPRQIRYPTARRSLFFQVFVQEQVVFSGQVGRPEDYHEVKQAPSGEVYCVNPLNDPRLTSEQRTQLLAQMEQALPLPNLVGARVAVYPTEHDTDYESLGTPLYEFSYDGIPTT